MTTLPREQQAALPHSTTMRRSLGRLRKIPVPILICWLVLLLMIAVAIFAPFIAPYDPNAQKLLVRLKPPAFLPGGVSEHLLGTDQLGRDVLSRIIYSLRTSLGIAAVGTVIGLLAGTLIGLISGLWGGVVDGVMMMLVDTQVAVPFILIALTAVAVFGNELVVLILVIGFAGWETYARLSRGQVLAVRNLPFVEASLALGASKRRLAFKHILPNIASPIIVLATLNFSSIVLLESALSFLGLGVQPPTASLGSMVGLGRDYMASSWWIAAVPGLFILLLTMVVSLIGDWLRDTLDANIRF